MKKIVWGLQRRAGSFPQPSVFGKAVAKGMLVQSMSVREVARQLGVSRGVVERALS